MKPSSPIRIGFLLASGAGALTAMLFTGCATGGDQSSERSSEAPISAPSETAAPAAVEPTASDYAIDAALMDDPEAFANEVVNKLTLAVAAGATKENADVPLSSGAYAEYATEVSSKLDPVFFEAFLIPDYSTNPNLLDWSTNLSSIHQNALDIYFRTAHPELTGDEEPFRRGTALDEVVSSSRNEDGSFTITMTIHDYNNADKNAVGENIPESELVVDQRYPSGTMTATWVEIDGNAKMSDWKYEANQ